MTFFRHLAICPALFETSSIPSSFRYFYFGRLLSNWFLLQRSPRVGTKWSLCCCRVHWGSHQIQSYLSSHYCSKSAKTHRIASALNFMTCLLPLPFLSMPQSRVSRLVFRVAAPVLQHRIPQKPLRVPCFPQSIIAILAEHV
ncbi:hypothetical protein L596_007734 [Steinernema carpocapsae]|uniref:Uncharacterized protein n=1 Tax=Steinernema carpocapsae TaxID=34508 RepID=A0A4U5PAM3_STECR|nr:hypothetical protein L596_007734 [Steinernema carpocapsae]